MSGQSKDNYNFKTIITVTTFIGQRPIYFDACQGCKKKIIKQNDSYYCEKTCMKNFEESNQAYNFLAGIQDYTS